MKKKKIAIVATGGTIAGSGAAGKTTNYEAGTISVDEVLASIPDIRDRVEIVLDNLFSVDSNEIDDQRWLILTEHINKLADQQNIDGIVVTHGTDTMEETSYFLNLTVNTLKPVVLTGAMRPATATSADGPFNLFQAIMLASHSEAWGRGVMCLFSSTIFSGRDIQKISNYKIDAFDQRAFANLGYMKDDEVYFSSQPLKRHTTYSVFSRKPIKDLAHVAIADYYVGASPDILDFLAKNNEGIVIVGTGSGNYSKEWRQRIEELSDQGIIFVRASRVTNSIIFQDDYFDPKHVCLGANNLSPYKARILLMLFLTITKDKKVINDYFLNY